MFCANQRDVLPPTVRTTALRTRESPTSICLAVPVQAGDVQACGRNSPDGTDHPPSVEVTVAVSIVSVGEAGGVPVIVDFFSVPEALLACRIRNSVPRDRKSTRPNS